ncbi:MAG TPA: rhodanese-like domain-containing protein [Draconibacterium sp.]|nr:rhodanese-like domain-containing protein [Draconibacterium sp.]
MKRNYFFLTILMLLLAVGALFLNETPKQKQLDPQELLREIIQPTRYVTTDQVARMIIQKDPSLQLIDVRSSDEFEKFSLPNSINVPLDSLLTTGNLSNFGIPGTKVVFVSNDDINADQAWVLTKRLGYSSTYVMTGGLNRWMETIIQPAEPSEDAPLTAFENYEFRKGAQLYFTGAKPEVKESSDTKVQVVRRKKTVSASGGC